MRITNHNKIGLSFLLLMSFFLNDSVSAAEKATVTSKSPITMTVKKAQSLSVTGATIHNAKSASILSAKKQAVREITTSLTCKAPTKKGAKGSCDVKLTIIKAVPLGKYTINLIDAKKQTLASGQFEVKVDPVVAKAEAKKKAAAAAAAKKKVADAAAAKKKAADAAAAKKKLADAAAAKKKLADAAAAKKKLADAAAAKKKVADAAAAKKKAVDAAAAKKQVEGYAWADQIRDLYHSDGDYKNRFDALYEDNPQANPVDYQNQRLQNLEVRVARQDQVTAFEALKGEFGELTNEQREAKE